uniref:Recep_L_domain domain-containing protein n=1 Tax=Parastrongyloides trichosuri TaxID=131310 RepID=A0A0N4ZSS3_PARTI
MNSTYDSCSFLSSKEKAECSEFDFEDFNVCCGTQELLIDILSNSIDSIGQFNSYEKRILDEDKKLNYDYSKIASNDINIDEKDTRLLISSLDDLITEGLAYIENAKTAKPMNIRELFDTGTYENRVNFETNYGIESDTLPQPSETSTFNDNEVEYSDKTEVVISKNSEQTSNSINFDIKVGPLLSIITTGLLYPGNITNLWHAETTIVLFKEGDCTVLVNTGMPIQKKDIVNSLASKGLSGQIFNYTIITSGVVHFIGNIELFPSKNLVVETNLVNQDSVMTILWYETSLYKLCSPNLSIIKTPGVTHNSVTVIAKNVPGMGTVAVGGSLFLSDENLFKIERSFIQNDTEFLNSRKKIICLSDWIVPAYGNPVIISKKMKHDMSC